MESFCLLQLVVDYILFSAHSYVSVQIHLWHNNYQSTKIVIHKQIAQKQIYRNISFRGATTAVNLGGKITVNKGVPLLSQLYGLGESQLNPLVHHISPNFRYLQIAPIGLFSITNTYCVFGRWRGGATSRALDLRSIGCGFKSYSGQRWVTTLDKLFTPMCLCTQQYNLVPAKRRLWSAAGKVTAGLVESNGSLPPGGWLTVTCGLIACTPGSAPGTTLGIQYGKAFTFTFYCLFAT